MPHTGLTQPLVEEYAVSCNAMYVCVAASASFSGRQVGRNGRNVVAYSEVRSLGPHVLVAEVCGISI